MSNAIGVPSNLPDWVGGCDECKFGKRADGSFCTCKAGQNRTERAALDAKREKDLRAGVRDALPLTQIPPRYRGFDLKDIAALQGKRVAKSLAECIKREGDKRGLVLFGPVGTGKTTAAYVGAKIWLERGQPVTIISWHQWLNDLALLDYQEKAREIGRVTKAHILVLDELGAIDANDGYELSKESRYRIELLGQIINHRYEHNKSTIITSNLDGFEQVVAQYGDRTASRMQGFCNVEILIGDDLRKESVR